MLNFCIRRFSKFCQGCGTTFQHTDASLEGFIPENRYKNTLVHNIKASKALEDIAYHEKVKIKDFRKSNPSKPQYEEIDTIEEIEERMKHAVPMHEYQEQPKIKPIVCMRCFKISKYNKLPDVDCSISHKSPEALLTDIFSLIRANSIIINVVDLIDFNGSLIQEVFSLAEAKNCYILLVLNKTDALPIGYKDTRIYQWGVNQSRGLFKDLNVCSVSSRTGEGFDRVISILRTVNKGYPLSKTYVIGATNSGKSSFINKLAEKCWNLPLEKFKLPLNDLTTSSYPGTTLSPIEVPLKSLDIRIIDTPGIPTLSQITFHLKPEDMSSLIPNKRIKPIVLVSLPQFSFWIGALVRIDMIEGEFKYLTFFVSHLCTVHKTKRELVEDVYSRQRGKLLYPEYKEEEVEWETHWVEVACSAKGKAARDLVVHGLGWVSVTGEGRCTFEVKVAKGVGFNTRDPLMPYEARSDRVMFTKGKTINSEKIVRRD